MASPIANARVVIYDRNLLIIQATGVFNTTSHLHPSLMFAGKARSLPLEASLGLATPFVANVRLGWKCLVMTNGHYSAGLKNTLKSSLLQAPA